MMELNTPNKYLDPLLKELIDFALPNFWYLSVEYYDCCSAADSPKS